MKLTGTTLDLSATDLANFLGCKHRTALDLQVARNARAAPPKYEDPQLEALWKRGMDHELAYVGWLKAQGRAVTELSEHSNDRDTHVAKTIEAMRAGAEVIVQGALREGHWFGKPDVLLRVSKRSALGAWSYEVADTKLARTTKAGTILQLGLYSEMVAAAQGLPPERFFVVTPRLASNKTLPDEVSRGVAGPDNMMVLEYRLNDYAAYLRLVRRQMDEICERDPLVVASENYPDPVPHCQVCHWSTTCDQKRHADDHISLVAGVTRAQRRELEAQGISTLTLCATTWPLKKEPARGSLETYENAHKQALLQLRSRPPKELLFELRPIVAFKPATESEAATKDEGLCRLPVPSPGDVFLDLEGDPYAVEGGREYLFGVVTEEKGTPKYAAYWGFNGTDERVAFEAVMDLIAKRRQQYPDMHVFHYAPYETTAFKKLRLRYETRSDELDVLLTAGTFVDLYAVVRQGVRVGSEGYSIKNLEPLYGFTRQVDLRDAGASRVAVEMALQSGEDPDSDVVERVRAYNEDDCVSTLRLRDWLEKVREECGQPIPRPTLAAEEPKELREHDKNVRDLRPKLLSGIPEDAIQRSSEQKARWLLAYLLDYHRREALASHWEYYRLRDLPEEDLEDEPRAITGLGWVERVAENANKKTGKPTGVVTDRYSYPPQDMEILKGTLKLRDGGTFGKVAAVDRTAGTIDVRKVKEHRDYHPTTVFEYTHFKLEAQEKSLLEIGRRVDEDGAVTAGEDARDRAARSLLLSLEPRLTSGKLGTPAGNVVEHLTTTVLALDHSVLPVQGPPGSGKTYAGAEAICALVAKGKKVGVAATGHKVICNLLEGVADAAKRRKEEVRLAHKGDEDDETDGDARIALIKTNAEARRVLDQGDVQVLGGTAWLWSSADMVGAVDVLFVDEAGQVALANVLAMTPSAESIVLLGDPQQLDQPKKASHPDGVDVSALEYALAGHITVPDDRGVFLPSTWRMCPLIAAYTSEVFYESRLSSREGLEKQMLNCADGLVGAGLQLVLADHEGNRSYSNEEVRIVVDLVERLLSKGVTWTDKDGTAKQIQGSDVLVVAPYNAQVSRLATALAATGARVGTVDKFQGQGEAVVIYSMATSRPEDAPRGMEFLYSLNRLNVATSRARCAAIVVASRRLFEPECHSPRQMKLANALCRYRELAARG